jgi:RNA polymerase sigma-70 factor (ECF subfamily)
MQTVVNPVKLRHVMGVPNVDYQSLSDEELMMSYSRGDAVAFDELYLRNKAPLYRYFLRQTSQVPVAEELTHEVWLRVINARQRYLPKAKFTTYLFQIAHNCIVDHYRKFSRAQQVDCDDQFIDSMPANAENNPEKQLDRKQVKSLLVALIKQLPSEQREVFILKEEVSLSIEEIATVVGENPETIKSRLRYAVNKLKAGLQGILTGT